MIAWLERLPVRRPQRRSGRGRHRDWLSARPIAAHGGARGDYETWLIAAPAVYTVGLGWAYGPEWQLDLVLPLPPSRTLAHYEPLSAREFMDRVAAEAVETVPREDDKSGG